MHSLDTCFYLNVKNNVFYFFQCIDEFE